MDTRSIHQETGAAWDKVAVIYERAEVQDIALLQAGGSSLLAPEQHILGNLAPWCQRAVHLQCAGGTDTLSLLHHGAAEVMGVDISPRMIEVARRKTYALQGLASWFCCDVLDTPQILNNTADLVYTGKGALPWVMDISAWAQVVARILKPGGQLFVFEGHPLNWVWNEDTANYVLSATHGNYFSTALNDQRWPAPILAANVHPDTTPRACEHQWTLGEIVNALVGVQLTVEHLQEHPEHYWDQFVKMPAVMLHRLPHTFSLLMRKS